MAAKNLTRDEMTDLPNNVTDVALIFEGGGMRCSYSSAILTGMLRSGIFIDYVAGISGGASCVVNYAAREPERARKCFVEIADDPNFGDYKTFLRGKRLFYSDHIYDQMPLADGFVTFDGITKAVKASSSLPILMPPVLIDGEYHIDGAVGTNAGIPLDVAKRDGYEKFVIVLTQPRDFTKKPLRNQRAFKALLRRFPNAVDKLITRHERYNAVRDEIVELEAQGKAYVFWADDMMIGTGERNVAKLARNYELGAQQYTREEAALLDFLGL